MAQGEWYHSETPNLSVTYIPNGWANFSMTRGMSNYIQEKKIISLHPVE